MQKWRRIIFVSNKFIFDNIIDGSRNEKAEVEIIQMGNHAFASEMVLHVVEHDNSKEDVLCRGTLETETKYDFASAKDVYKKGIASIENASNGVYFGHNYRSMAIAMEDKINGNKLKNEMVEFGSKMISKWKSMVAAI